MATKVGMNSWLEHAFVHHLSCFPAEDTTVTIDECNADKGGDSSSVEDTQFGQFCHQHVSCSLANARNGLEIPVSRINRATRCLPQKMRKYGKLVKKKYGPLIKIKFLLWQVCDFTIFNIKRITRNTGTHRYSQFLLIENFLPKYA